ncbi:hypothetical protein T440DRAFT_462638 [Plenodomus tracheiphilus IPT5]|uniref:Uncharacterized protein n=1 Tax=Plenodomus tracheiphilus IPT5 TaxID=1408161 RepID=A0A6A7ALX6_9PLEO|nr:hypothetical protein T440DRAFT_462638 [Plenodomus tracheiphilus IPT5]
MKCTRILFGEDYSHVQGYLPIDGELFLEAMGRPPLVYVFPNGSTFNINNWEGYIY